MPRTSLPCASCTLDSFHSTKYSLLPKARSDSIQMGAILVWIFPSDLLTSFDCVS